MCNVSSPNHTQRLTTLHQNNLRSFVPNIFFAARNDTETQRWQKPRLCVRLLPSAAALDLEQRRQAKAVERLASKPVGGSVLHLLRGVGL